MPVDQGAAARPILPTTDGEEVERETGFEPATFCLGSRRPWYWRVPFRAVLSVKQPLGACRHAVL